MCLYLEISSTRRKELPDIRQGAISSRSGIRSMETLSRRRHTPGRRLDRSQKSGMVQDIAEIKSSTSPVVALLVSLRLQTHAQGGIHE